MTKTKLTSRKDRLLAEHFIYNFIRRKEINFSLMHFMSNLPQKSFSSYSTLTQHHRKWKKPLMQLVLPFSSPQKNELEYWMLYNTLVLKNQFENSQMKMVSAVKSVLNGNGWTNEEIYWFLCVWILVELADKMCFKMYLLSCF